MNYGRILLWWLPMVVLAFANGALRQLAFQKPLGELRAHQLSTAVGIVLFGLYIRWLMVRWQPTTREETLTIGVVWLGMTVLFEFGMGRLLLRREWSVLLHDYNLLAGRVWVLILLWVLIAPTLLSPARGTP